MAGSRTLVIRVLRATRSQDRFEGENLPGGFADELIGAIRKNTRIPERLAFVGDQHRIADLQVDHRVQQGLPESDVVWIGQGLRQGEFGQRAVTGLALDVLDLQFITVQIAIPHRFDAGVTVDAIEGIFALRKLSDGLVIILQPVGGMVSAGLQGHAAQVVIPAVMAGIALGIRDGGSQAVDLGPRQAAAAVGAGDALGGSMAGGATAEVIGALARQRGSRVGVTGETVLTKCLDGRVGFLGRVEGRQAGNAAGAAWILNSDDPQACGQIRLGAKGEPDTGDRTGIGGLDAGGGALDMIVVICGIPAVAIAPATGGFDHRIIGGVGAPAQRAMRKVRIQGQPFATVTNHAAEGDDRVGFTDLGQVGMTGQAIFHLAGQGRRQRDRFYAATLPPGNSQQGYQQ